MTIDRGDDSRFERAPFGRRHNCGGRAAGFHRGTLGIVRMLNRAESGPDMSRRTIWAVSSLCMATYGDGSGHAERMVALLIDGLRHGTNTVRTKAVVRRG